MHIKQRQCVNTTVARKSFYLGWVELFSFVLRCNRRSMLFAVSEPNMLISILGTIQRRTWKITGNLLPPFIDIEQPERQAPGAKLQYIYE